MTIDGPRQPPLSLPLAAESPPRWKWVLTRVRPFVLPAVVAAIYAAIGLYFLPTHRYQINPDGVGYLSVADNYAAGHFRNAVSAYWSPLYSWLLLPLRIVRVEPLLATKILGLSIGVFTLAGVWRFLRWAGASQIVRALLTLAIVPLVMDAAMAVITPDLLMAGVVLWYLASVCSPRAGTRWGAVRIGVWMGVAFLAKAYALPFVLGHAAIIRAIEFLRPRDGRSRARLLGDSAISLAVMIVIAGAWAAVLSAKFGTFTLGSTGRYNLRIDAPHSPGQVMHWAGFLPPPSDTATSAWDDITPVADRMPAWSPLASTENRAFVWTNFTRNSTEALAVCEWFTPWCLPILLAAALIAFARAELQPRRPGVVLLIALVLYPLGYCFLHIERRFMTAEALLMVMSAGYAIARARRRGLLLHGIGPVLAAAAVGYTFVGNPYQNLFHSRSPVFNLAKQEAALKDRLPVGANLASDGNWSDALYLSYLLHLHYFGEPRPDESVAEQAADLQQLGVTYLLAWKGHGRPYVRAGWESVHVDSGDFHLFRVPPAPRPADRRWTTGPAAIE